MNDQRRCKVLATWDPEGEVWVATSHDVRGLALAAPNEEELVAKLRVAVPDLLIANVGSIEYDAFVIDYLKITTEELQAA